MKLLLLALTAAPCLGLGIDGYDGGDPCTTLGPATMQLRTSRGATTAAGFKTAALGVAAAQSAAACQARCCTTGSCAAWSFSSSRCELLGGVVGAAASNGSATSGVVYRPAAGTPPLTKKQPSGLNASDIRGFNYVPPERVNDIDMWLNYSRAATARDMRIAKLAGFNFARVFLNVAVWEAQPKEFLADVAHFISTAHENGVNVMPIPYDLCWFGCRAPFNAANATGKCWYPSPQFSKADDKAWWSAVGEKYVDALVGAFPMTTPGLALWDVVNEPESGGATALPGEKKGPRWTFVKHFVEYFRSKGATTTVGVAQVDSLVTIGPAVDVLSFHSYHGSWELGLRNTRVALAVGHKEQKAVFNSETGCIARANAFDQTMEIALRHGIGFAVWELMISDCLDCIDTRRWKHGLMYKDGTSRDPAAIAAIRGVYLNRGDDVALAVPRPDVEHRSSATTGSIRAWLSNAPSAPFEAGVLLLDTMSNLAESSLTLPTVLPLSGRARALAAAGDTPSSRAELQLLLSQQVGALMATKMGSENDTGVCSFSNTTEDCADLPDEKCLFFSNADLQTFAYTPASTSKQHSCWTDATDTPMPPGSLHYCNKAGASADIAVELHGGAVRTLWLVLKRGPDGGQFSVAVDGGAPAAHDAYAAQVDWSARIALPYTPTGTSAAAAGSGGKHTVRVKVLGTKSAPSTNAYVQLVALEARTK